MPAIQQISTDSECIFARGPYVAPTNTQEIIRGNPGTDRPFSETIPASTDYLTLWPEWRASSPRVWLTT